MIKKKASIICVFNDKDKLDKQLLSSISGLDEYELVLVDNTKGNFKSAAAALNYGATTSSGDILIFSHQDIFIKSKKELDFFVERISQGNIGDIYGAQGARETERKNISNITAGEELCMEFQHEIDRPIKVSCVDEGFFGMYKATFLKLGMFDEELCDNWHLYAVELSLRARKAGYCVYVDPIQLHHFSYGHISQSYMKGLIRLCDMYRDYNRYIWTTCYKVRTNYLSIRILYLVWWLHRILIGKSLN